MNIEEYLKKNEQYYLKKYGTLNIFGTWEIVSHDLKRLGIYKGNLIDVVKKAISIPDFIVGDKVGNINDYMSPRIITITPDNRKLLLKYYYFELYAHEYFDGVEDYIKPNIFKIQTVRKVKIYDTEYDVKETSFIDNVYKIDFPLSLIETCNTLDIDLYSASKWEYEYSLYLENNDKKDETIELDLRLLSYKHKVYILEYEEQYNR